MDMLHYDDRFMVCADFESYLLAQHKVATLWRQPEAWWRMSILNTAGMGWFSSDRAIGEYAANIWGVPA
jgi:starch phosphorylase